MKLRNKKTGEIVEPCGITCVNGRTFVRFDDGKGIFKFEARSLAQLNENYEDCQDPKEYWYICSTRNYEITRVIIDEGTDFDRVQKDKEIGNYFETIEEAEKAVEKLKAFKRLQDLGFTFNNIRFHEKYNYIEWRIKAKNELTDVEIEEFRECLHKVFGGEDESKE